MTKLKPVQLCYTTKMWRGETIAGSCNRTLTIYTKEMTQKLVRRHEIDGCGTTAIPQSVMSKENKWNKKMTHGRCLCVSCMCSVMREGMREKSK